MAINNTATENKALGLTEEELEKLSPMMRQYVNIKREHENSILFYRLGDFYEMFFEDAKLASGLLQIALTGRDCGLETKAPMCGVPFAHAQSYIDRLLQQGYNVAICEQIEDASQKKGMLERKVIKVYTPATVVSSSILLQDENNYICCIYKNQNSYYGMCFADVSTGEISAMEFAEDDNIRLGSELVRMQPKQVLINNVLAADEALVETISQKYGCKTLELSDEYFKGSKVIPFIESFYNSSIEDLGLGDKHMVICCVGALLLYIYELDADSLKTLQPLKVSSDNMNMAIDATALRDLEIVNPKTKSAKGTALIDVLNRTKTGMGARLLRQLLTRPMNNVECIEKRLDAVEELVARPTELENIREQLSKILDFDRVLSKITYGTCTPRDIVAISRGLRQVVELKSLVEAFTAYNLRMASEQILDLTSLADFVESSIVQNPPISLKDGGVIAEGFDEEIDRLRELSQNFKGMLAQHEAEIRERTGVKSIKIHYNHISGYFYEVSTSNKIPLPEDFIRKQALTSTERYITAELKELEEKLFTAGELLYERECFVYEQVLSKLISMLGEIHSVARGVCEVDIYASLAYAALENDYVRPKVDDSGIIDISSGRHPIVEQVCKTSPFVPNDTYMDMDENLVNIITGPNMSGKSTYMKAVALICIMAQVGSFVPAKAARIGIVNEVFTRVGATDDMNMGQSTFMVEMVEMATIMRRASSRSLVILDELGRGTSTYDGMSIAGAVLEYIADKRLMGAKTLFSTHYHEITELADVIYGIKNYKVTAEKRDDGIVFLRRILAGKADESYGIEVAKLAGLPRLVTERAESMLKCLESGQSVTAATGVEKVKRKRAASPQMSFELYESKDTVSEVNLKAELDPYAKAKDEIFLKLSKLSPDELTPRQAMELLYELCSSASVDLKGV